MSQNPILPPQLQPQTTPPRRAPTPLLVDHAGLLEMHGHTIFSTDADGYYIHLSPSWETLTGYPLADALGCHFGEFMTEHEMERLTRFVAGSAGVDGSQVVRLDTQFVRLDGTPRTVQVVVRQHVDSEGAVIGATGTLTDVTDRHRDELQLRHSQKMEAVGRLAAGIAHEINTPIQFIGDNLNFLSESFERVEGLLERYRAALDGSDGEMSWAQRQAMLRSAEDQADIEFFTAEVPDAIKSALDGTKRVASIVRAMKAFDHPNRPDPQPVDINEVIRNTLVVSRNETKYVAHVETELGDVPIIAGDQSDLGQVFLNLFVNAADAMRSVFDTTGERGLMTVTTSEKDSVLHVEIRDTGGGIPSDIADQVFDPFFTTKEIGKGTGQGLPLARAVVERHGGSIWFDVEPGTSTTFHVTFPAEWVAPPAALR